MEKQSSLGKWIFAILAAAALAVVVINLFIDNMPKGEKQVVEGYKPWDKETIDLVATLPVQDGGRIKPFSTLAGFNMLRLHGARSMKIQDEKGNIYKLKPTEWLMDSVFRPHLAIKMPTFRIDNSKVLEAINIKQKGRRDRYSYMELAEGRDELFKLARSYEQIKKDLRESGQEDKFDPVQQQTMDLAYNIRSYETFLSYFTFARLGVVFHGTSEPPVTYAQIMSSAELLQAEISRTENEDGRANPGLKMIFEQVLEGANYSRYGLFILPPSDKNVRDWLSAGNAIYNVMSLESKDTEINIKDIAAMEHVMSELGRDEKSFRRAISELKDEIEKRAELRGELTYVKMEHNYFKRDYFLNAMVIFLIGAVSAFGMWSLGQSKLARGFYWVTLSSTVIAVSLCVVAIIIRCIIMQRPPVGNLYDTIIFIAATGVILSLIFELVNSNRIALGLAPVLGTALIILARRYEVGDAGDHLDPLVAVLDSNFWLTTHVICITLGYSAGLLSAVLACGYVLMRGLNLDGDNRELRRSLTKAVYASVCLTVFLSLVGTVLGGIWANYSWGRFWGWDPKENGALMIVLWTLAILHARIGGIIKEWGLHLASLFTACVVAFSWWHVNFLGVGLHNYGFTSGKGTINVFYIVMLAFMLYGFMAMLLEKYSAKQMSAKPDDQVSLAKT